MRIKSSLLIAALLPTVIYLDNANGQYRSSSRSPDRADLDFLYPEEQNLAPMSKRYQIFSIQNNDSRTGEPHSYASASVPPGLTQINSSTTPKAISTTISTTTTTTTTKKPGSSTTMLPTTTNPNPNTSCLPCLINNEPNDYIKSYVAQVVKNESSSTSIWILLSILLIIVTAVVLPMLIYLFVANKQPYPTPIENGPHVNAAESPGTSPLSEAFGVTMSQSSYSPPQQQLQNPLEAQYLGTSNDKNKSKKMHKLTKNTTPISKGLN